MRVSTDSKAALIVVDVQNGFIADSSAHVVPVITDLAARWLTTGGHVVFTRYHNYPGSPFERLIGWSRLQGPPDTDLVNALHPFVSHPRAHMIDKTVYTAFTDEGRQLFAERGFTDLFICGIATDGCVLKTTVDAFEAGYTPWVLTDACASNATRHPPEEVHRAGMLLASRLIGAGQLITVSRALAWRPEETADDRMACT